MAAIDKSWVAAGVLCLLTIAILFKYILDSASVVNCIVSGFKGLDKIKEKQSKLKLVKVDTTNELEVFNSSNGERNKKRKFNNNS